MRRALCICVMFLLAGAASAENSILTACGVPGSEKLVVNFHRVDGDIYRGGRPSYNEDTYLQFALLGIRTIINLEGGDQARQEQRVIEKTNEKLAKAGAPTLTFISYPIGAFTGTVLRSPANAGMTMLFQEIQTAPKPIYIHCEHGKDRTGLVVMLYRMWRGEETYQEAFNEAKYYRFSYWNFGLKRTLDRYRTPDALKTLGDPPTAKPEGVCKPGLLEQRDVKQASKPPQVTPVTDPATSK